MNITGLGQREAEFLSRLAQRGDTLFTTRQAQEFWGGPVLTSQALHRLQRKGWIERLARGVYMVVPLAAGPERHWAEDSFVVATHLAQPAAIAYWSAMHYWNMTEQIPQIVFVQTTRRKHKAQTLIGGVAFRFIVIAANKLDIIAI
jgi:predicted transcriptional regulator of viral defense system